MINKLVVIIALVILVFSSAGYTQSSSVALKVSTLGGVMYNDNHIDINSEPAATFEIGDTTYSTQDAGTLEGKVDFNDIMPYIGIGWDTSFGKNNRFGLLVDLGVVYQGSPDVDLSADGPLASNQAFQNDLQTEEDKLKEDLEAYEYYPVIGIGLSYRF